MNTNDEKTLINDVKEYKVVRDDIKSGDLLAWSKSPTDKVISNIFLSIVKFFTKSNYGHVGIAWRMGGRLLVVEAVIPFIHVYPVSKRESFYWIPTNIPWTPSYIKHLLKYLGTSYSIIDCIRAYLGDTDPSNNRWQCAELCNDYYKNIGINLGKADTPVEIVEAMLKKNGNEIYLIKTEE